MGCMLLLELLYDNEEPIDADPLQSVFSVHSVPMSQLEWFRVCVCACVRKAHRPVQRSSVSNPKLLLESTSGFMSITYHLGAMQYSDTHTHICKYTHTQYFKHKIRLGRGGYK